MAAPTPTPKPAVPQKRWFLRLPVILLMVGIGVGQVLLALVFLRSVPAIEAHADATQAGPADAATTEHAEPNHDDAHQQASTHAEPKHAEPTHGESKHTDHAPHAPAAADPHDPHDPHSVETEVDLGNFALTIPPNKEHPTLLVTFHIFGTIDEHHAPEFNERHDVYRHRIRQEVLTLVRQCDLNTLGDPNFTSLKKQMLERINRVLQTAAISDLIFSEFAILEH